ncbi:MAG: type II toxin-antitoxin system VapC family toxin [Chitinivibrionia bacterium]|nr:type II toxin-antitoxin system VapC family toxin [Chitinivibrionia bacterium]MCL1946353.1 type II toxin-antitoxin system VapC family toxin [Chitinivibrionia bacterium]
MINKKSSLYLDTSVIGGYYDDIFMQDTRLLFEKIKSGKYNVFISELTKNELKKAPENVKNLLEDIKYQLVEVSQECKDLAGEYIKEKVVGATSTDDCVHIATATINGVDFLVSWNFKHIVNVERIKGYNSINIKNGYKQLEIRSPKDMGVYDDE